MKKRILSLLLCIVMVLGLFSVTASAETGANGATTPTTVKVDFTAQASGAFLFAPKFGVEVASNLAESYGYADSVTDGVSALDVLVKAHEAAFGTEFTSESKGDYLVVSSSGFVTKLFGTATTANGFVLNGGYPNDGTDSPYGGGYNGTTVTTTKVVDNDFVEFFVDQDQDGYSDEYAFIDLEGNIKAGATVKAKVSSIMYMNGYHYKTPADLKAAATARAGVWLGWVDAETGIVTKIAGALTDFYTKTVSITLPNKDGTYLLTAFTEVDPEDEDDALYLVMPVKKVVIGEDSETPTYGPCDLTALSVGSYDSNPNALEMSPAFGTATTEYSVPELSYHKNAWECGFYVKATAADENAVITASMNGVTQTVTSGDSVWKMLYGAVKSTSNTLTVTVTNGSDSKVYTVNVPAAADPASLGTVTIKGQHSAMVNSFKLYTYTSGTKGTTDLLDGKTPTDGAYPALQLAAGDYWLEGYKANGDYFGGIKLTVEAGKAQEFTLQCVYKLYTNSGWVKGTDYTMDVRVESDKGERRVIEVGEVDNYGTKYPSCLCLYGDTATLTVTPDAEKHPTYIKASASKTLTGNVDLQATSKEGVTVTFNVPEGSTVSVGTLTTYYVYTFLDAEKTTATSATFRPAKGTAYFYRIQNPNGVTYWNFKSWSADTTETITADDLHIGDSSFTKSTVYHNYEKNVYDRADIYLNINAKGYKAMQVGDTFELNVFRNWMAIESFMNAKVALPDMHYQVIDESGKPSDILTITPNANNSCVAEMKATKPGTAIVLVTYDAMTHMQGQSSTASKQFSAIWPECTGAFIVTVGATEGDIQTNMVMDRMDATISSDAATAAEQKAIDSEHDILFYTGSEGASYSFKPESGCTVTVDRSKVTDKMTFTGFTDKGVSVAADGTVTVSKLTTGRHIIKIEKDGKATYQLVTAREVSYKLVDAQGNELTEEAKNNLKAGDKVTLQFSGLLNPKEKLSGAYNFNFCLHYKGEDGTYFNSNPGSTFGVYDFSGNPARQKIEITIPQYFDGNTYTLTGALLQGGFSGVTHRSITYAKGVNKQFDAPSASGMLSVLPEVRIKLAETTFLAPTLTFKDNNGNAVNRSKLTITLKDAKGNATIVKDNGSFAALAGEYTYVISGAGYEYQEGTVTVVDGTNEYPITLVATSAVAWDGTTKTEPSKDADGTYLISTGSELAWFVEKSKTAAVKGKLTADIDLAKYAWLNVSTMKVELDGAGHEIKGLNATKGLFSTLGRESYVHDLTIRGTSKDGGAFTGMLSTGATLENCFSYVTVKGTNFVGGIAGQIYTNAAVLNCANFGSVTGTGSVGGIVGSVDGSNSKISGCYNTGAVTGGNNAGGIFGASNVGFTIENCYNTGKVSGTTAGGIGGKFKGETHWSTGALLQATKLSSCYNVGEAPSPAFGTVQAGTVEIEKCYYLSSKGTDANATGLSEADMKQADLNKDAFAPTCNGYPALKWQKGVFFHESRAATVVPATCTEGGYTLNTCSKCSNSYKSDYTPATGHRDGTDAVTHPAYVISTCPGCNTTYKHWNDDRLQYAAELPDDADAASNIDMEDVGAYPWKWNAEKSRFESSNVGVDKSTSETKLTFTLTYGGTLAFNYGASSEDGYDKVTITLNSETIANGISGTTSGTYNGTLEPGSYTLTFRFVKDDASAGHDDLGYFSDLALHATTKQDVDDAAAVAAVIAKIDAIGSKLDPKVIKAARDAYDGLRRDLKVLVTNYDKLTKAEKQLALINAIASDDKDALTADELFDDVAESSWYCDAVTYVYENGLMNGTGRYTFSPSANTTRGMVVTILARMDGVDTSRGEIWYSTGREWAMENGISDGTNMTAEVTREQLATILYRYADYCGYAVGASASLSDYSDASSVSAWAKTAVQWAVAEGLINGRTATTLAPKGNATRAEVAAILMRFDRSFTR